MGKKKYTDQQKEKVIALLTLGEKKSSEIARETGVNPNTVRYMKTNLKKIQEKDGTLGYHTEERGRFVRKGWKIVHQGNEKILKALKTVVLKTPKDIRDMAVIVGIYKDKIDKATPQPQLEAGVQRPLIDLSKVDTKDLEVIVARFTKRAEAVAQLKEGEVIEGESREIT